MEKTELGEMWIHRDLRWPSRARFFVVSSIVTFDARSFALAQMVGSGHNAKNKRKEMR